MYGYVLPPRIPGRPEPKFNGNGQYVLPPCPDTGKTTGWTRASTVAKTLEDTLLLEAWAQRQVLVGVYRSETVRNRLERTIGNHLATGGNPGRLAKDLRNPLNDLVGHAQDAAESGRWAEFGTAVHAWTEWVDGGYGPLNSVPEMFWSWVAGHRRVMAQWCLTPDPRYIERTVICPDLGIAGTLDRLFWTAGNVLTLGDVKTSARMDYSWMYFAVQLAIYHSAKYMLSLDGTQWEPMPELDTDTALVSHLPREDPDKSAIVPISMSFGREALAVSMLVRSLRSRAEDEAQDTGYGVSYDGPDQQRMHYVRHMIETSQNSADLAKLWEEHEDIWTDDLTQLGRAALDAATQRNA